MSHQATTWVMEFSESRLSDRLVLLAIAHRVSNDDGEAFPAVSTIAREANLSESSVHYSLKALCNCGELEIRLAASKLGTNIYRLPKFLVWVQSLHPPGSKVWTGGVQSSAKRGPKVEPEPSFNHQEEPSQTRARVFSTPEFERFWEIYPNKVDKAEANREWFHVPFADKNVDAILGGVILWKASDRWQEERYIPYPAKFLKAHQWEAKPPGKPKGTVGLQKQLEELERKNGLRS